MFRTLLEYIMARLSDWKPTTYLVVIPLAESQEIEGPGGRGVGEGGDVEREKSVKICPPLGFKT